MSTAIESRPPSKAMLWAGYIVSVLPALALIMSGAMKFTNSPQLIEGFTHLGWPDRLAIALGILELTCTVLYLIPQTSVLGAILLTGYLGGAIATHVRIGELFIVQALLGVAVWLGLYLRDPRLRALIPLRT
jgi:uncharacterized membrane protein YphA (DoxX/SURF4 family)